ncbi:MAG TPA: sigma-70 family RNA polymerase sigma factor [Caulobacterales bacterium]|nr:sigma-70 family RNA polymerase sigma factor [Caulobacterales bacterium]
MPVDAARFAALLSAIASRQDRDAFAELFAFYAPRVKSYLMRLGAPDSQAEEIAQDVMATVWRKAGLYDSAQASPSTWIFRIARNRRIDVLRRTQRPPLDGEDPSLQPIQALAPDEAVSVAQAEQMVRDLLPSLPEEQLVLIHAAFYEGQSHAEIAEQTGLPLGTVKSRIRLALEKLRVRLGGGNDRPV